MVIYELPSAGEADRIGAEFLRYLGSGTGAVQYPRDAQFVLRRVGPTLVFFAWSLEVIPGRARGRAGRRARDGRHAGGARAVTQSFRARIIQAGA